MRDPSFTLIYGDLKTGKTACALAAFPTALFVAAPGALNCAQELWGFDPPQACDFGTFQDITKFALSQKGKAPALVVDDASLIADRTILSLGQKYSGHDLWAAVFNQAIILRDTLRRMGMHIVFTTHAVQAEMKDGVRLKGGPALPGQMRSKLPAAADLLLRTEVADGLSGILGWPIVFRSAPSTDWLDGDRNNVVQDPAPMNLGEILRAAGYSIPRLPGLSWQEPIVENIAKAMEPKLADKDFIKNVFDRTLAHLSKQPLQHALWTFRDGYDRAVLRAGRAAHLKKYYFK